MEALGTASGTPSGIVTITDCGIYVPHVTPASGFWYDQPDHNENTYTGISSTFIVRPRVAVIGPSANVVDKFDAVLQPKCCSVMTFIASETATIEDPRTDNIEAIVKKVYDLLSSYSIDVILIAPACRNILEQITIPESFAKVHEPLPHTISKSNVILECKPLDALTAVYTQSWLHQYHSIWKFDTI